MDSRLGEIMAVLLDGRFAPLTHSIAFLNTPPRKLARALVSFFNRVHNGGKATRLHGTLSENLMQLQPLVIGSRPRILLTSTTTEEWTAMFDGHALGQGVDDIASYMAEILKIRGYGFANFPPAASTGKALGGRQFHMLGPEERLGLVRTIDLIENNPGRWHFETSGTPQPYEDLKAYTKRRKTERFTEDMLVNYAAAVGLHPWDETFYHNPSYLITNNEPIINSATLAEARTRLGLNT